MYVKKDRDIISISNEEGKKADVQNLVQMQKLERKTYNY